MQMTRRNLCPTFIDLIHADRDGSGVELEGHLLLSWFATSLIQFGL